MGERHPGLARVLAALLLVSLGGCARAPAPNLYLLAAGDEGGPVGGDSELAVGVGPVELPEYLDRPQIITRIGEHRLQAAEAHQWAEPLKDSIVRALISTLARELRSNRVHPVPQRVRSELDWRVEVDIARLDATSTGKAVLLAQWRLVRGDAPEPVMVRIVRLEESLAEGDYDALVATQTRLIVALGMQIADAISSSS